MSQESNDLYVIPARFRKIENLHIFFWLVKDICWCVVFKPLGIIMIVPTLSIAIWIAWKNRHIVAELAHNLAIAVWILANSLWMVSEFFAIDEKVKPYCIIPFAVGILILSYYYFIYAPLQRKKEKAAMLPVSVTPIAEEA